MTVNSQATERGIKGRQDYIVPSDIPQIEPRNIEERFVHILERNMKGNKSNTRYMCKVYIEILYRYIMPNYKYSAARRSLLVGPRESVSTSPALKRGISR